MTDEIYDVAIVGYGPTGLVAAAMLGQKGHSVVVIERYPGLYGLPRLTHIDGEAARIVQAAGDVDYALRDAQALDSFRYLNAEGEVLVELPWAGESCGHPAHISMYQPDIEDAIDARIRQFPNVTHMNGWQATDLSIGTDHVVLTARPGRPAGEAPATENERIVRAKYLLGADGANSFVREAVGIDRTDLGVAERWLNIDTKTVRPLPDRFNYTMVFADPARPHMFMPIGTKRQRFEFSALEGETAGELESEERAWQWLNETHGLGPDDVEIIRQVLYPIGAKLANSWSSANRVFLLGDAAHTMPPTMGQGACSGMRDAINIAWKLDLVLRGRASDELLATYEAERKPHADAIVQGSVMLGDVAYTLDPERAAARDAAFLSGSMPPPPPFPIIESGVVHTGADGLRSKTAGSLAPQGLVRSGDGREGRFDDLFGNGFQLISRLNSSLILTADDEATLAALGCSVHTIADGDERSFVDVGGTYAQYFNEIDADVIIARPDFVVFGACAADQVSDLIAQLAEKVSLVPSGARRALATS